MENFWSGVLDWFKDLGSSIYNSMIAVPEGDNMNFLTRIILALVVLILGRFIIKLVFKLVRRISGSHRQLGVDVSIKTFTIALANLVMNLVLAFICLGIIKVDYSSMASIISSATVAIGLSLQDLISAFASGVVLLNSRNFRTGDYIKIDHSVGSCEGTVSSVGLIASTLETFENQHIVIPNNLLLQGVITNYSVNPTRRLTVDFDVDYSTNVEKCKKVMQEVVKNDTRILSTPTPITAVYDLKGSSIDMRLVCYTKLADYWDVFYDIREKMLLAYRANDISIPFTHYVVEDYKGSDAEHQAIELEKEMTRSK